MTRTTLLLAVACALGGCAGLPGGPPSRLVTARGAVHVGDGYRLQALRQAYTLEHLDHIEVYLLDVTAGGDYDPAAGNPNEVDLGPLHPRDGGLPPSLQLSNLKPHRRYEVRLEAYQVDPANGEASAPVRVDDRSAANITPFSTDAATVVPGAAEDDVSGLTFMLQLADQPFSGQAGGGIQVSDGTLVPGDQPLDIVLTPVAP